MKAHLIGLAICLCMSVTQQRVCPAAFLVGAQIYLADSTGKIVHESYRYTTNSTDTGASALGFRTETSAAYNYTKGISYSLLTGLTGLTATTTLEFDSQTTDSPGSHEFVGINLFFSSGNISFNPAGTENLAGHLTLAQKFGRADSQFIAVEAGVNVQDYAYPSPDTILDNKPMANGLSVFSADWGTVSVEQFFVTYSDSSGISGSITFKTTLSITAVPEPATLGLGAIVSVGLCGLIRKRLRREKPQA